jgi:2-C-methyl-D-erythritol 4-phosphate cytidylyltransferase
MQTVIITAGGFGKRMGSEIPKQFILLNGKAVLMHTIERFYTYNKSIEIILTLPEDWHEYWKNECKKNNFCIKHTLVNGGVERYHSIKNALKIASGNIIAVHDGVRPLICETTIERCFQAALNYGAAIPVVPAKESVRWFKDGKSKAVPRQEYMLVQTPQVFQASILNKAYLQEFHDAITDDASLVEQAGFEITLVEGNEENIKITYPSDVLLAEILLKNIVIW